MSLTQPSQIPDRGTDGSQQHLARTGGQGGGRADRLPGHRGQDRRAAAVPAGEQAHALVRLQLPSGGLQRAGAGPVVRTLALLQHQVREILFVTIIIIVTAPGRGCPSSP